jgi:hypothetical protein
MSELSPLSSRYRRAVVRGAHALPLVPVAQSLPAAVLARFLSERLATTAINERPKALARQISSSSYCYGTRWARKFYRNATQPNNSSGGGAPGKGSGFGCSPATVSGGHSPIGICAAANVADPATIAAITNATVNTKSMRLIDATSPPVPATPDELLLLLLMSANNEAVKGHLPLFTHLPIRGIFSETREPKRSNRPRY